MDHLRDQLGGEGGVYLGDAVYAYFDGFHVWLKTTDGIRVTNAIALEPSVLNALEAFVKHLAPETEPEPEDHADESIGTEADDEDIEF